MPIILKAWWFEHAQGQISIVPACYLLIIQGWFLSSWPRFAYLSEIQRSFSLVRRASCLRESVVTSDDGVPLNVYEAGDRRGPMVLLTAPLGISCVLLVPLVLQLERYFHVVTWESRGLPHLLPDAEPDLSPLAHERDLMAVLKAFGKSSPDHVVSYCSGANVALLSTASGVIKPRSLCLISPPVDVYVDAGHDRSDYQKTMLPLLERAAGEGLRFAALVRAMLGAGGMESKDELSDLNNLPFATSVSTLLYARLHSPWRRLAWREALSRLQAPVLILHGDRDDYIHPQTVQDLTSVMVGSTLRMVPNVGHFGVCESSVMQDLVLDFLGRAPAASDALTRLA